MTIANPLQGWNAPSAVSKAVQNASARTGVDFSYLMNKAEQESGFKTDVKAKTSSATGLYQFIEKTWLKMVKDHGADYGLKNYADQIDSDLSVDNKATRAKILELRKDPNVSALMAAEFTKDNQDYLEGKVGGKIGQTELYFAHFMGAGGAGKFLNALKKNPDQTAASLFPTEAAANKGVFYKDGKSLSLQQVYNRFAARFDEAPSVFKAIADEDMPKATASSKAIADFQNFLSVTSWNAPGNVNPNLVALPDLDAIFNQNAAQNLAFLTSMVTAQMDNPLDRGEHDNNKQTAFSTPIGL